MDTQQLPWTRRGLRCLAKRHFDGRRGRAEHHLQQEDFFLELVPGFESLNHHHAPVTLSCVYMFKVNSCHLDAAHPLLSLELLAVLQPVDGWRWVSGRSTAEFDSVGSRNSQKLLVHPVRPGPIWSFCW